MCCKTCNQETSRLHNGICEECEIAIQDHQDNLDAGICTKCNGSCENMDGTPCDACEGVGFVR